MLARSGFRAKGVAKAPTSPSTAASPAAKPELRPAAVSGKSLAITASPMRAFRAQTRVAPQFSRAFAVPSRTAIAGWSRAVQRRYFAIDAGSNDSQPIPDKPEEAKQEPREVALVVEITADNIEAEFNDSPFPVIVFAFSATTEAMKTLANKLITLAKESRVLRVGILNADANPQLLQEMNIPKVPTMLAVYRGKVLSDLVGMPTDAQLDQFIGNLVRAITGPNVKQQLAEADKLLEEGKIPEAAKILSDILNNKQLRAEAQALAGLARCALKENKLETATTIIDTIKNKFGTQLQTPEVVKAMAAVDLASTVTQSAGASGGSEEAELRAKLEANPDDLETRYNLGVRLFSVNKPGEAIDEMIKLIRQSRDWNEQAARKFLVKIFDSLGPDHELTKSGRRRFSNVWFA